MPRAPRRKPVECPEPECPAPPNMVQILTAISTGIPDLDKRFSVFEQKVLDAIGITNDHLSRLNGRVAKAEGKIEVLEAAATAQLGGVRWLRAAGAFVASAVGAIVGAWAVISGKH